MGRAPTEDEKKLWLKVAQRRGLPGFFPKGLMNKARAKGIPLSAVLEVGDTHRLDKSTSEKLTSGKMPIDGKMDLHGMTVAQAEKALDVFVAQHIERHSKCILVVTGKGKSTEDGIGVLKKFVPLWLSASIHRSHILAITQANKHHGGDGAYYIRLSAV